MKRKGIFITGIGTNVGKTVISAILTEALEADYWKPIQAGDLNHSDSMKVERWISNSKTQIHPEGYRLHTPMSPHAAAEIDGIQIELNNIQLPITNNFLIAEGAGGLLVPLNDKDCVIDLIQYLQLPVVLVSRHYLGSINHTLLSIEALQRRNIPIAGLIFNGETHAANERIIEKRINLKPLFTLSTLENINKITIQTIAEKIKPKVQFLLNSQ